MANLESLPHELLVKVLCLVPLADLVTLVQPVSHQFDQIIDDIVIPRRVRSPVQLSGNAFNLSQQKRLIAFLKRLKRLDCVKIQIENVEMQPIHIPITQSLTHLNMSGTTRLNEHQFATLIKQSHHLKGLTAELSSCLLRVTNLLKTDGVFMEGMKRPLECLLLKWPQDELLKHSVVKSHSAEVKQFLKCFANKAALESRCFKFEN